MEQNFEKTERQVKQVIVVDKSKQMNVGKIVAQACHASLGALLKMFRTEANGLTTRYQVTFERNSILDKWLNGIFTKICLAAKDEEEMIAVYDKVVEYNKTHDNEIPVVLIEDSGLTCFHGVKTKTCVGIGPFWSDVIDEFTGNLKLFR